VKFNFSKQLLTEYETYVKLSGINERQKKKRQTHKYGKRKNEIVKKINGALFWIFYFLAEIFHENLTMIMVFYFEDVKLIP
jgi:hypothetical protein